MDLFDYVPPAVRNTDPETSVRALTAERLRELLSYDPETGIFMWRTTGTGRNSDLRAGWLGNDGYRSIEIEGGCYKEHRLAWLYVHGAWPPGRTDHRDGVKDNNRIANLRPSTPSQNGGNSRKSMRNTSGFKGVSFVHRKGRREGRWVARISINRRSIHLGNFRTPEQAHAAYAAAAARLFGEFARAA